MAEVYCQECDDLKTNVPELIVNGLTSTMCTSLQNDSGLKASVGNDDCTDLDTLNDCLIGNMETELEDFDVCEWKKFMAEYIPNDFTLNKAMICAICGLWTSVHSLEDRMDEAEEQIRLIWECLNA